MFISLSLSLSLSLFLFLFLLPFLLPLPLSFSFSDKLEQRCDELTSYHQTLLLEKSELNQVLNETQQRMESLSISGSEGGSPQRSTSEPNVEHLRREVHCRVI